MNKKELITAVAEKSNLTKAEAKTTLNTILTIIGDTLAQGDEMVLTGFGSFKVKHTQARTGRNPRTGESVQIPAKNAVVFKASKGLKEAVQEV